MTSGLNAYLFVGFVLAVWWCLEAARDPAGRLPASVLTLAVLPIMIIWPVVLITIYDSEDRWKR